MNPNLPRLLLLVWCAGASCLPAEEGVGWNQDNALFKPASAFEGKIESFLGEPALSMTRFQRQSPPERACLGQLRRRCDLAGAAPGIRRKLRLLLARCGTSGHTVGRLDLPALRGRAAGRRHHGAVQPPVDPRGREHRRRQAAGVGAHPVRSRRDHAGANHKYDHETNNIRQHGRNEMRMNMFSKQRWGAALAGVLLLLTSGAEAADRIMDAMKQQPPAIDISTGNEIPSEGYCDQPYIVKLADGTWLCTMTTGKGDEGNKGQHIVSSRSSDHGKTWEPLVAIEPPDGPEASWVMPYLTAYGRVYVFYTYNAKNMREVIAANAYSRKRVDTLGEYALKYSDDGGKTWSARRFYIPVRETGIDRRNPYKGQVRFFWGVGKPIQHKNSMYLGFTKVESFGENFIEKSESFFLRCNNIDTERDPEKLSWQTLPEGDQGLISPKGPIASEVYLTSLSDGSLFCTYRTVAGHPCHAYSRDDGRTWTRPAFMTYGPGGKLVDHPRAANFVWKLTDGPYAGRYIYWFHNNRTAGWGGRNPVYLLGGIEVDGPNGKLIQWGNPVAILYDKNPKTRISYPDSIWDDGLYITETQKSIARVHRIPDDLLRSLWTKTADQKPGLIAPSKAPAELHEK